MKLRPMSEAPRDGTAVLAYYFGRKLRPCVVAFLNCDDGLWSTPETILRWSEDDLAGWLPIPYPDEDNNK